MEKINIYYEPKGSERVVSPYFKLREFQCKCENLSCTYTLLSQRTLDSVTKVRVDMGYPVFINSGYRCLFHNIAVLGALRSRHTRGLAVDLTTESKSRDSLNRLAKVMRLHFDYVKVYDTFVHGHNNEELE